MASLLLNRSITKCVYVRTDLCMKLRTELGRLWFGSKMNFYLTTSASVFSNHVAVNKSEMYACVYSLFRF